MRFWVSMVAAGVGLSACAVTGNIEAPPGNAGAGRAPMMTEAEGTGTGTGTALPADGPRPRTITRSAYLVAVSLDGIGDGIRHYRNRNGARYATYAPQQIVEIADNILLLQRTNGGWIENQDPTRVLGAEERAALLADKVKAGISFDNRNIFSQVEYLAAVFEQTNDARYREAARRGIEVITAYQHPTCGGWPHTVPAREPYHSHITIADEVTPGVLTVLRKVAAGAHPFEFGDAALRVRATQAVERGDACLVRLQVIQRGLPTGWAGQYDSQTLRPALGRSYELPAIVAWESTAVLRYLMGIEAPSPAVVRAVEGGVAWLERSKITGVRLETVAAEPVRYKYHASTTDRRLVEDLRAPPLWARFYDLADNGVVLANRDGRRAESFAEIARERRTGYTWYGDWPARLLSDEYPAWRARLRGRPPAPRSKLQAVIESIAAPAGGVVGFAALDLASGRSFGMHQADPLPMQSVFKLPVAIEVLRQVDEGRLDLDRVVALTAADARFGIAGLFGLPSRHAIGDLLAAMVINSDNVACDKLLALVGGPQVVDARIRALGIDGVDIRFSELEMSAGKGDNTATPDAMVALLALIARNGVGLAPASAQRLEDLLLRVGTGPRRLKGALPARTPVAHKTGTSRTRDGKTDATNDVGLVALPNSERFAIAVFVHASPASEATREATIARLARATYNAFNTPTLEADEADGAASP